MAATALIIIAWHQVSSQKQYIQIEQRLQELEMAKWVACKEMGQVKYLIDCISTNPFVTSDAVVTVDNEEGVEITRVVLKDCQPLVFLNAQTAEIAYALIAALPPRSANLVN